MSGRAAREGRTERIPAFLLGAIFVVALGLRLGVLLQYERAHPHADHPVIDERAYDDWARAIAAGDWIGDEVFFQEPLYPYAMALLYAVFGPDRTVVRAAQCLLGALACMLIARIAGRLFGRAAAVLAGLALAVYRPALWLPSLLLKENLFLVVLAGLALAILAARGPWAWLGAGVLAALGALLRGNLLVLLPAIALWPVATGALQRAARRRERAQGAPPRSTWICAAAATCGMALVLAPVALRNHRVGGVFALSTSGAGTNLYGGNNAQNPYGSATEVDFVRGIPAHEADDWRREAERRVGRVLDPGEVSAYWRDQVLLSVRADPGLHLRILWNKLRLTLGRYEVPDNHLLDWDARYVPLLRAPLPGFGVLGALGLAGAVLFCASRIARVRLAPLVLPACAGETWQVLALAALYAATVVLTVTSSRIRLPLVALLAPAAGFFLAGAWRALRTPRGRARALAAHAACLALAVPIVWTPVLGARERAEDLDERDFNLAVQLVEEGRDAEARAIVERLARDHPRSARMRTTAAQLDWRRALALRSADPAAGSELALRAQAALEEVALLPGLAPRERFRAQALLGWIRLARGDAGGALEALRAARAFDADDLELVLAQARALEMEAAGLPPDARLAALREAREILLARKPRLDGEDAMRFAVALSRAESALGRELLDGDAQGADLEEARDLIRTALRRLEPLADAPSEDVRRGARAAAGWIQLHLRNAPAAERHFRAVLALDAADTDARLGLLQALLLAIDADPPAPEAAARRAEAQRLLDGLAGGAPDDPALLDLRRRLDG